ncbi:MAG: orotidine-5'-phosphate decarboxylase [Elusimicrobia bacterium]|jgi:orotidine-5'-phosphate decarboxylase|nr:orotidine-5'-phosphate decarboxylase [Elusimicrobiota bacterium]
MTELIVALDVDTIHEEESLLERLKGTVTFYKVGLRLFTAHGKRAVDLVHRFGGRVFLDLKFHDIPQTVAHAVAEAQKLGVEAVSLHLSGGGAMLKAAAEVHPRPKLWGVTVLTSLGAQDLRVVHPRTTLTTLVKNLARLGWINGIDGTICSGHEVAALRRALPHLDMRFITPGIRPAESGSQDQKRVMTPGQAAALGVNCIVVGRPITRALEPLKAAQGMLAEMRHAAAGALEKP